MSLAMIAIPCSNEAKRLPIHKFEAFARAGPPHRFLLVNDGSTERTRELLQGLYAADPQRFGVCHLRVSAARVARYCWLKGQGA
jgi:dolichyl-phosphate beta-glucosyltransferase